MPAIIRTSDLSKTYSLGGKIEVPAIKGIAIEIEKGEFVGIMGPSGGGKSTLLHQLGLLDRQTSGTLSIKEIDITHISDRERTQFRLNQLGYVFQDYALLSDLSVLENVALPAIAQGKEMSECYTIAEQLLHKVGLGKKINYQIYELSGGEQQRVSIARALVNSPAIVFADEPCANLDTENSRIVLELFRSMNREMGQTIVMVSHEPWHREFFDRVIFICDGSLNIERMHKKEK